MVLEDDLKPYEAIPHTNTAINAYFHRAPVVKIIILTFEGSFSPYLNLSYQKICQMYHTYINKGYYMQNNYTATCVIVKFIKHTNNHNS